MSIFANQVLTGVTNLLFGGRITDMETCYKVMEREVAALEKRLAALLAKDETSCKEQGRQTFAKGSAGLLGILGTKKDAGPCRPPSPFTGDAVAKSLGVKAPESDFGALLGKPPAKSKSR